MPAVMVEWQDSPTVIETLVLPWSFIVGVSYIVSASNSFLIIVPDFGDLADPVYATILSEVNRLRGAGIRWALAVDGAP